MVTKNALETGPGSQLGEKTLPEPVSKAFGILVSVCETVIIKYTAILKHAEIGSFATKSVHDITCSLSRFYLRKQEYFDGSIDGTYDSNVYLCLLGLVLLILICQRSTFVSNIRIGH